MAIQNNNFKKLSQGSYTEHEKMLEKFAVAAFLVSILVFAVSIFFGLNYGIFFLFMELYFAMQGLKSTKRGKAFSYATFVLGGLTIISIVIQMAIANGLIIIE